MATVGSICESLDSWYPNRLAANWDNVGLLYGTIDFPVKTVLLCLTITSGVVSEAAEMGAEMIISHHPVLLAGAKRITNETTQGKNLLELGRLGVAIYSPHTAHDSAQDGVNHQIAERLGMKNIVPIHPIECEKHWKLIVFSPASDVESLYQSLFDLGAGKIGIYSECSYKSRGIGSFRGEAKANPVVGQPGIREKVEEWRLEIVCPQRLLGAAKAAIRSPHRHEEPAFDLIPLNMGKSLEGEGRIGYLAKPLQLIKLAELCQGIFAAPLVQVIGDPRQRVRKLGIGCGAAGGWFKDASNLGADAFITGEMKYHEELEAFQEKIGVVLLGHHASEGFALDSMRKRLEQAFPGLGISKAKRDDVTRRCLVA